MRSKRRKEPALIALTKHHNGGTKAPPYIFLISHSSFIIHYTLYLSPLPYGLYSCSSSDISRSQSEHFTHQRWISPDTVGFHCGIGAPVLPFFARCAFAQIREKTKTANYSLIKKPKRRNIRSKKSQNSDLFAIKKAKPIDKSVIRVYNKGDNKLYRFQ